MQNHHGYVEALQTKNLHLINEQFYSENIIIE